MIGSYSSPFAVGHKALERLWDNPVWLEEKVDGSQFSFRREGGALLARSHKQDLTVFTNETEHAGMFRAALDTALELSPMLHVPRRVPSEAEAEHIGVWPCSQSEHHSI